MKTIARLATLEAAHLLRSVLAEEGIQAVVLDEGSGGHFLGSGSVFADFRVQVAEEQAELARPFVEEFTGLTAPPVSDAPIFTGGSATPCGGISARMFQALSLATFLLHFLNRQILQSQDLSVLPELRRLSDAMAANPSTVALLERFNLVWEVVYGMALLGFAALWRRARVCYLIALIWLAVFIASVGPGTAHGIPAMLSWVESLMGMFLLGVSCCPPLAEHFGARVKK